jgi:hypothetical protein
MFELYASCADVVVRNAFCVFSLSCKTLEEHISLWVSSQALIKWGMVENQPSPPRHSEQVVCTCGGVIHHALNGGGLFIWAVCRPLSS